MTKVYHVHLKAPYHGKTDYYFSSKAAIYQELPKHIVGISLKYLQSYIDLKVTDYENENCIIKMDTIVKKTQMK